MIAGVYKITNTCNGKIYIGSSIDVLRRFSQHKLTLRTKKHCNRHLQFAWEKYGESSFTFETLEECKNEKDILVSREQYYLDALLCYKRGIGYNIRPVADTNLGVKHTAEFCARISARNKGKLASQETKAKMSVAHTGKIHTPEHIAKRAAANIGNSWNRGRKMTEAQLAFHIEVHSKHRKPVIQMTLELLEIAEHASVKEARKALDKGHPNIQNACTKGASAAGYYWKYKGDCAWKPSASEPLSVHCKVEQYALTGELIATWNSLTDAVAKTGIKKTGISQCCTGAKRQSNGFIWKYLKPQRITPTT